MGELFQLQTERAREALERGLGSIDSFSDVDDLSRLLSGLAGAELIARPPNLEILVYPCSVEEPDLAVVSVFSTRFPSAHVMANSESLAKMAGSELWKGEDDVSRTLEALRSVVGLANGVVGAVRALEARARGRGPTRPARCPHCGIADHLRAEHRRDVLGWDVDEAMVLADEAELTDVFCLACGEEVEPGEAAGDATPPTAGARPSVSLADGNRDE